MLFLCITLLLGSSLLEEVSSVPLPGTETIAKSAVTVLAALATAGTPSTTPSSSTSVSAPSNVVRPVVASVVPGSAFLSNPSAAGSSPSTKSPAIFDAVAPVPSSTPLQPSKAASTASVSSSAVPSTVPIRSALSPDSSTSTKDDPNILGIVHTSSGGGWHSSHGCNPNGWCGLSDGQKLGYGLGIGFGVPAVLGAVVGCCKLSSKNRNSRSSV